MLKRIWSKIINKYNKTFKQGDFHPLVAKAAFKRYFRNTLDKGSLSAIEINIFCSMTDSYFDKFVIQKDKVTIDESVVEEFIWTLAESSADKTTTDAIIGHLREKYYPTSRTIH